MPERCRRTTSFWWDSWVPENRPAGGCWPGGLEAETLEALNLKSGEVIATGGGTPCREGRMDQLRALGTVVWLDGELRELHARASRIGNRPMLEGRSMAEIAELYRSRRPFYGQAHVTVDTTGLGVDQVVARVLSALRGAHATRV